MKSSAVIRIVFMVDSDIYWWMVLTEREVLFRGSDDISRTERPSTPLKETNRFAVLVGYFNVLNAFATAYSRQKPSK
jgi:hypothetical protein